MVVPVGNLQVCLEGQVAAGQAPALLRLRPQQWAIPPPPMGYRGGGANDICPTLAQNESEGATAQAVQALSPTRTTICERAPSGAPGEEAAPGSPDPLPHRCPLCVKAFTTASGCRLHQRKAHPGEFHMENVLRLASRPKPGFTAEEIRVAAEFEHKYRGRKINPDMRDALFPDRTLDSVRGLQNKNPRYKRAFANIAEEEEEERAEYLGQAGVREGVLETPI